MTKETTSFQVRNLKVETKRKLKAFASSRGWKMSECLDFIVEKLIPPIK